jgi:hypothetical protein
MLQLQHIAHSTWHIPHTSKERRRPSSKHKHTTHNPETKTQQTQQTPDQDGYPEENSKQTTTHEINREIREANKRPYWQFGVV